jgi:Type IV secretion-system coupling protein DNA-binding domain
MDSIVERADVRRTALRNSIAERFSVLCPQPPARLDRTTVVLGRNEHGEPVRLPLRARMEHCHAIGTTGGGKTKYIEHLARQDVIDGRGICIVDPHGSHPGSLFRSMLCWLDARGFTKSRVVHLIDPNAPTHVTGFNPLTLPAAEYEPTVIAEATQEAIEKVWGEEDLNSKPTLQRVLSAVLTTLTELELTLAEAGLLFDPADRFGVRSWAIANLANDDAREELEWLHDIASEPRGHKDFRQEVVGPRNRLAKLTRDDSIRLMVGQQVGIDIRKVLDEGHIVLANLSPGPRAGDKATQVLGRLLTRSIFFHAVRRLHPDRPFLLYLDECQLYLSGDVSRMLAEVRKFGIGVLLSHQTLAQLETAGLDILDAVKNTTNIKVAFRAKDPEEATQLADMVLRYDLEMPVRSLVKPTLVGHRLTRLKSESASDQFATTNMHTRTRGTTITESSSYTSGSSDTTSESAGISESESQGRSSGISHGSTVGSATGTSAGIQFGPPSNVPWLPPTTLGTSQGESAQASAARSSAMQRGDSQSSGKTTSSSTSSAHATSESWTEGTAVSESVSVAISNAETVGHGKTAGWQETLEAVLEDRPTAVHGLENVRYMAASVLRNLTAGRAAINFVDSEGMKAGSLTVANVESYALPQAQFEALRERVLEASPSAVRIEEAAANVADRHNYLKEFIAKTQPTEPETPAGFKTKRKRRVIAEPSVDWHDERSAPERTPVKGSNRLRRRPSGRP